MRTPPALVGLLADGQAHDPGALAATLQLEPAALAAELRELGALGLTTHAAGNGALRLSAPLHLLDAAAIRDGLAGPARARLAALSVVPLAESTNSVLLARPAPPDGRCEVLIAEYQSGGRGRRGRSWVAPYGSGLLMSVACRYAHTRSDLSGVTLAVGVALVRTLRRFGLGDLKLKWPNDVLAGDAKLAGVLCELKIEAGGPAHVVVGVGLNVALPRAAVAALAAQGRTVTDVITVNPALHADVRQTLATDLVGEIILTLDEYGRTGLASFIEEWRDSDALSFRAITFESGGVCRDGVACGVAADGALLVDVAGEVARVEAGEVSVRTAP